MENRTRTGNRSGADQRGPNVVFKFVAGILILQAFAVCLFVIWYWWTTTDRSFGPAGVGLIMTSLFIAGAAANSVRARLVIEPDAVVVRDVFSTRRIKRSDISGTRTVYAGRQRGNELWLYDTSGQPIPIPSELQDQLLNDPWVAGLEDLDQADIKRNSDSFATDERLGETEGDRRWNGSAWQFWTNILNFLSFPFLVVVVRLPFTEAQGRWPVLLVAIAIPLLAVGINLFSNGAVDLVDRGRDDGPSVPFLSWAPLVLLWRSFDVHGGHWGAAWGLGLCLAIPVTFWLTRLMREAGHSLDIRGPATYLMVAMYFASSILLFRDHREILRAERESAAETLRYEKSL